MDKQARSWKCPAFLTPLLILSSLAYVGVLKAEPLTLSGGINNRASDNVTRASTNEISDIETRVNLRLNHQSDPGRCQASTSADLGYGIWQEETFDPQDYVSLDFNSACELARGLSWELSDSIRDVSRSSRAVDTPDNRTRKNVFRTGPVYSFMLSPVDRITLSAKYVNTSFDEREQTDSERYIGTASWNHSFSETLSGGLQFNTNRAELDTGAEIDTDTTSVLFSKSWPATRISGSVGFSESESRFGGNTQASEAYVGDLSFERDINPVTQAYIRASRQLTDQTSDFDIIFDDFVFNLQQVSQVEVTALDAGIERQFSDGSGLRVGLFANRSDFIGRDEIEDSVGMSAGYSRPLAKGATLQSQARYGYRVTDTDNATDANNARDDTYSAEIGVNLEMSRNLSAIARIGHAGRNSEVGTSEYRENWVSLGLNYQFF